MREIENRSWGVEAQGWCARVCIGIRKTSKRMRVNWRATVTQPIPDMDTCLYRLHQLRPTNQTRISPVRCTNRAWPFSTLLSSTSSLSRPSPSPSPSSSPFYRLSPLPAIALLALLSNLLPPRSRESSLRNNRSPAFLLTLLRAVYPSFYRKTPANRPENPRERSPPTVRRTIFTIFSRISVAKGIKRRYNFSKKK